ncbi:hypothetical protein DdX_20292 [Ditylenchus destructor]|uniref:Uncharacterized protein n=1 Tax=Ditylenchus destructor TaxID=166010 RepID=A0AAD4MIA4_9BILA|nr:hypothetical protein DdX_20292 [Ditylenchus destructor]
MSLNRGLLFKLVVMAITVYCLEAEPLYNSQFNYYYYKIPVTIKRNGNEVSPDSWDGKFTGRAVSEKGINYKSGNEMNVTLLTSPSRISLSSLLVFELQVREVRKVNGSQLSRETVLDLKFNFLNDQYKEWHVKDFNGLDVEIDQEGTKNKATLSIRETNVKIELNKQQAYLKE